MSALILSAELPVPPSANSMYRLFRGSHYPSSDYKNWLKIARETLLDLRRSPIEGQVAIVLEIFGGKGFTEIGDLDNCFKAVGDVLQSREWKVGEKKVQYGACLLPSDSVKVVRQWTARYIDRSERARLEGVKLKDLGPAKLELKIYARKEAS